MVLSSEPDAKYSFYNGFNDKHIKSNGIKREVE
jgi:hypothetical protein